MSFVSIFLAPGGDQNAHHVIHLDILNQLLKYSSKMKIPLKIEFWTFEFKLHSTMKNLPWVDIALFITK